MGKTLLIRADGDSEIGAGHVMRCLALAQGWQRTGGRAVFAAASIAPGLETRLKAEGAQVVRIPEQPGSAEDAVFTAELARRMDAGWVVADGYRFRTDYQHAIKAAQLRLLCVDDMGDLDHYAADTVLNQNPHATEHTYSHAQPGTRLLLGTDYALLRGEFLKRQRERAIPNRVRNILVTMGGADTEGYTLKTARSLERLRDRDFSARIVAGTANPNLESLTEVVEQSDGRMRLELDVADMSELMAWADMAVSAAGSTCWELAYMGLPSILVVLVDNQQPIADELDRRGAALSLGRYTSVKESDLTDAIDALRYDPLQRTIMCEMSRQLVDGKGAERVAAAMNGGSR